MKRRNSIVYVIDDEHDVRTAIANLLEAVGMHVETFASAEEFLRAERPRVPSCVLLDQHFPEEQHDGLAVQRLLAAEKAQIPVIFITGRSDIRTSIDAMKSGAADFLLKPVGKDDLLAAVNEALNRHRDFLARESMLASAREHEASLSPREREIMALVARGLRNKQIAAQLGLSEITVKVHRSHLMKKMNVGSLAELVRIYDTLIDTRQDRSGAPMPRPAVRYI